MVSNIYINSVLKDVQFFRGTFSCNSLPHLKRFEKNLFVVNHDKQGQEGSHFVFLEVEGTRALYMDPLGEELSNTHIKTYLRRQNVFKIKNVIFPVQHVLSVNCGFYSLLAVIARSRNMSVQEFLNLFSQSDPLENDANIHVILSNIMNLTEQK